MVLELPPGLALLGTEVLCGQSSHTKATILEGKREMLKELSYWSLFSSGAGHLSG